MHYSLAAAMRGGGQAATTDQIQQAWRTVGMPLPAGAVATAVRSLISREVAVVSDEGYAFAVDLQRLWLDKHRHLDWVKEELEEAARKWTAKAQAPPTRKPRQPAAPSDEPAQVKRTR